jgi:hypothetical protein
MARLDLDDREFKWLDEIPMPDNDTPETLHCYLEFGHVGPHVSLGQSSGVDEYWVRWTLRASEIVKLGACPERDENDPRGSACLLFDKHPGRHTFERLF